MAVAGTNVAPPAGDRWGPGTRVPMIVISTLAKRAYVDHTEYDTTSIPRTIEVRWGLDPLGSRDARANDLRNAFDSLAAADGGAGVVTPSLRYEATREEVMREHGPARPDELVCVEALIGKVGVARLSGAALAVGDGAD